MFFAARRLLAIALLSIGLTATGQSPALAQERLTVVTSFSIVADFAAAIGGDRVDVVAIVGPGEDAHTFEPTPADARALATADLVIINGLEFESWIDRLIESVGFTGPVVVATDGITPLAGEDHDEEGHDHERDEEGHDHEGEEEGHDHEGEDGDHDHAEEGDHDGHDHGQFDPHAWQDVSNTRIYVANIAAALTSIDPDGAGYFADNLAAYDAALAALDADIRATIEGLPDDRRTIVTSHDAFRYFEEAYGLHFIAPLGINPEAAPGAMAVAALIEQIETEAIGAVFIEALTDPRLIEQIARETGVQVGGALYSDTLSEAGGPAATYLDMMRHNVRILTEALGD